MSDPAQSIATELVQASTHISSAMVQLVEWNRVSRLGEGALDVKMDLGALKATLRRLEREVDELAFREKQKGAVR